MKVQPVTFEIWNPYSGTIAFGQLPDNTMRRHHEATLFGVPGYGPAVHQWWRVDDRSIRLNPCLRYSEEQYDRSSWQDGYATNAAYGRMG